MNLYAVTMKGILDSKEACRRRLLQQMAAAVLRKQGKPAPRRVTDSVASILQMHKLNQTGAPRFMSSIGGNQSR